MAGFQFRLQTVLDHRERVEDEAQRRLAQILRQRMILEHQIRRMQQDITDSRQNLAQGLVGEVDVRQVSQFAHHSIQARQRAQSVVRRLAALEGEIQQARQALLEAARDRKALQLLRDRHHREWQRQQNRLEEAALEELATQAWLRERVAELRE